MNKNDYITARMGDAIPEFEEFFSDMQSRIPALQGQGVIEIPPDGFKRALKVAYLAGAYDALRGLITNDSPDTPLS